MHLLNFFRLINVFLFCAYYADVNHIIIVHEIISPN